VQDSDGVGGDPGSGGPREWRTLGVADRNHVNGYAKAV